MSFARVVVAQEEAYFNVGRDVLFSLWVLKKSWHLNKQKKVKKYMDPVLNRFKVVII